ALYTLAGEVAFVGHLGRKVDLRKLDWNFHRRLEDLESLRRRGFDFGRRRKRRWIVVGYHLFHFGRRWWLLLLQDEAHLLLALLIVLRDSGSRRGIHREEEKQGMKDYAEN